MHTDDTDTIIANELGQMMEEEPQSISEWMRLFCKRTNFVHLGHPNRILRLRTPALLKLNGAQIKRMKTTESLKVVVNKNLHWKEHFIYLHGNLATYLSTFRKVKHILLQSKLCYGYLAPPGNDLQLFTFTEFAQHIPE